jgi:tetratricopeptide (TPR) repeat protein
VWLTWILDLLSGVASAVQILKSLRSKDGEAASPFEAIPIWKLSDAVASPLRQTPPRIARTPCVRDDVAFQIIAGGSGVGKTRTALDTVSALAKATQAETVYLARRYVDASAPLPQAAPVRRVIVLIDDFDYGSVPASSLSFEDRQAAYSQAFTNLKRLRDVLRSKVDLYGFIATINTHRMPVAAQDVADILQDFTVVELPQISRQEHKDFIRGLETALHISFEHDARRMLEDACDGRFDTIATFLSSIPRGTKVGKQQAEQYLEILHRVWDVFRGQLSAEQQWVYDQVKTLKDFGLAPRIEYLSHMAHDNPEVVRPSQVSEVILSLWRIHGGQAIVYDGQFGPPNRTLDIGKNVARSSMGVGRQLRRQKRYTYQQELKELAGYLGRFPNNPIYLKVLRKCNRWFRRDRYFAYLLAQAYDTEGHPFRAIFRLYRIFRHPDLRVFFSGKWVEIQAHLLLAHLYQSIGLHKRRDWKSHARIEYEFEFATMLADLELPDVGAEGYELVKSSDPDLDWQKMLKNDLMELGYEIPKNLSLHSKRLRAAVHHFYSAYLLKQKHREHAALSHEKTVTEVLPNFGEAYITCAAAAMQLGNSERALDFLAKASNAEPQYMDKVTFDFVIARGRWLAYADLGNIELARNYFGQYKQLSLQEPLSTNKQLRADIELTERDKSFWQRSARLAKIRQKVFGERLIYRLPIQRIEVVLPSDWKIDREGCSTEEEDWLIAIFSSPVTWDRTTKTPSDAAVTLYYTTEQQHFSRDIESLGRRWFEEQEGTSVSKYSWAKEIEPYNLGVATFCQWRFDIAGRWPKTGRLLVFASPHARVFLSLMCEVCGQATFWTTLESVGQTFKQQAVFDH